MMNEARLAVLLKGETVADGLRPVASGEALRRVVGRALLHVKRSAINKVMLGVNQFAFAPDGCLVAYSIIRQLLADHSDWVVAATDLAAAFQRVSRAAAAGELLVPCWGLCSLA